MAENISHLKMHKKKSKSGEHRAGQFSSLMTQTMLSSAELRITFRTALMIKILISLKSQESGSWEREILKFYKWKN